MSRVSVLVARRAKGYVTELGPGVFGAETVELASSTRPTKREIPVMRVDTTPPSTTRGECSGRIGKQQTNEVHGEIAGVDPT